MAEMQGRERDFVLAPNELVFIQDQTKGQISVYVGPFKSTLAATDSPIIYDSKTRKFVTTELQRAIQQFPAADEGYYIVLENPAEDGSHPQHATSNSLTKLKTGCKINIPGPKTFPLWPGQVAQVVEGHRLRTNQYLIVRVYNEEQAKANQSSAVIRRVDSSGESVADAPLTMGKLLLIKGGDVSFYIPPTGIEVVPDETGSYVREAVTLERLEYCALLSEDGSKRYVRGPAVVFPEPTENFIMSATHSRKYKAIELNNDMGLYIKVTADYEEGDKKYVAGDELFITGKEQKLYYPRAEHSIIKYGDREMHYGVAIPDGEARYVLDKNTGKIELVKGPRVFLPDPRYQIIARRCLSDEEVNLWFPGNTKALDYNRYLRSISDKSNVGGGRTITDDMVRRSNKLTTYGAIGDKDVVAEASVMAFSGDAFNRGNSFTPPRTITLDTKYEGAVAISVWNGYAILVVDKEGNQRVEVGPKTVLLEYDETLQVINLSTGKPKTTDILERTVYLRVSYNQVSDIVDVVTKDMVTAQIKLSYRVNFVGEPSKWFAVENYVKFITDHNRSLLRNAAKRYSIEELNANYIDIVRDTILGSSIEGKRRGGVFEENGVLVYDVEVSYIEIGDASIAQLLHDMQRSSVELTLELASKERELEATRRLEAIVREKDKEVDQTRLHRHELELNNTGRRKAILIESLKVEEENEKIKHFLADAQLARDKKTSDQELEIDTNRQRLEIAMIEAEVKAFAEKAQSFSPGFIEAVRTFADKELSTKLAAAIAPLAIAEKESLEFIWQRVFKGTPAETLLSKAFNTSA